MFLILFTAFAKNSKLISPEILIKKSTFFFSGIRYVFVSVVNSNSFDSV